MKFLFWIWLLWLPLSGEASFWEQDFAAALSRSEREGKALLLFFHGSDWSGPSMKMKREILDNKEFMELLTDSLLFVELDFPQHSSLDANVVLQNEMLQERFGVTTFPSLLLLDSDQNEIARIDYLPESHKDLAQQLLLKVAMNRKLKAADALLENQVTLSSARLSELYQMALEMGQQEKAALLLAKGLQSDHPRYFQLRSYQKMVREGRLGSSEASSLRHVLTEKKEEETFYSLALTEFQELSKTKKDLSLILAPLKEYLTYFEKSGSENVWRTEMMIAQVYMTFDQYTLAHKYAKKAYEKAPAAMKQEIAISLQYIEKQEKNVAHGDIPRPIGDR